MIKAATSTLMLSRIASQKDWIRVHGPLPLIP